MKNQLIVGLITLAMLTACGKNMQIKAKDSSKAANPNATTPVKIANNANGSPLAANDGQLLALSQYDNDNLKVMPLTGETNATHTLGTSDAPGTKPAYIKNSTLAFRAIKHLPSDPKALKNVNMFVLVLHNTTLFSATDKADNIASQVLCVLDKKSCIGGKLDGSTALSSDFLSGAESTVKPLGVEKDFSNASNLADGSGSVFTHNPTVVQGGSAQNADLVLDLKALLGKKSDADLIQWIYDHSTVYDKSGEYRKIVLGLGNSLYADSGELYLDAPLADAKAAAVFQKEVMGDAANANDDVKSTIVNSKGLASHKVLKDGNIGESAILNETALSFDGTNALDATSSESVVEIAQELVKISANIAAKGIHVNSVMEAGSDKDASTKAAQARADSVVAVLKANGVKAELIADSKINVGDKAKTEADRYMKLAVKTTSKDASVIASLEGLLSDLTKGLSSSATDSTDE